MKEEILNSFEKVCINYIGNANSSHRLGLEAKRMEELSSNQILDVLKLNDKEVIYTSDLAEANNLAIIGIIKKYKDKKMNIITTDAIDSETGYILENIKSDNIEIKYIKVLEENIFDENTIMFITSEKFDKTKIKEIKQKYQKCYFIFNLTKSLGEGKDLNIFDLISFDLSFKDGLLGIGCLIKNKNVILKPIIHGGKSTTKYRSGTPPLPFIVCFSKSVRMFYE